MPVAEEQASPFLRPPARVLVVDDDPALRDLLAQALSSAGYHVSCAEDGDLGWHALCVDAFDLLITDNEMPRLRGLDLLRRVRLGPLQTPVIFISGQLPSDEPDFFRLLPPGVALAKPFALSVLLEIARDLMSSPEAGRDQDRAGQSLFDFDVPSLPATSRARVVNE